MLFEIGLVTANILSFLGNITFTSSSVFKKKELILLLQSIAHTLSSIAEIITKAYCGLVQEVSSLLRDIVLVFVKEDKRMLKIAISIVFVVIGSIVAIVLNIILKQNNWYDYAPVLATILYTVFLVISEFKGENGIVYLKVGLILNSIGWIIYTLFYKLYPPTIFNSITIVSSIITIIKYYIDKKREV